jgi:hypothetical protein
MGKVPPSLPVTLPFPACASNYREKTEIKDHL